MIFSAVCNGIPQSCGCGSWLQLVDGQWVRKTWLCNRHEVEAWIAATGAVQ